MKSKVQLIGLKREFNSQNLKNTFRGEFVDKFGHQKNFCLKHSADHEDLNKGTSFMLKNICHSTNFNSHINAYKADLTSDHPTSTANLINPNDCRN